MFPHVWQRKQTWMTLGCCYHRATTARSYRSSSRSARPLFFFSQIGLAWVSPLCFLLFCCKVKFHARIPPTPPSAPTHFRAAVKKCLKCCWHNIACDWRPPQITLQSLIELYLLHQHWFQQSGGGKLHASLHLNRCLWRTWRISVMLLKHTSLSILYKTISKDLLIINKATVIYKINK